MSRLRAPPSERFSGSEHVFDLKDVIKELKAENDPHSELKDHKQITVYKRAGVTVILFTFAPESGLANHKTKGLVTIHVLKGNLEVKTAQETYLMKDNMLLVLDPLVEHSLLAREETQMLLTVSRGEKDS